MPTFPSPVTRGNVRVVQGFFKGGRPPLTAGAPVARPLGSGSAFQVPSTVHLAPHGGGQPLPAAVLQRMEEFFGTSFADVRVHVGPQAASIGAVAFTMGSDLYFAPGQYDPHSAHGQRLLGHELAHVVQQRAGRVRNPLGGGVAVVQDPALEAEAERMGTRVANALFVAGSASHARTARAPGLRPSTGSALAPAGCRPCHPASVPLLLAHGHDVAQPSWPYGALGGALGGLGMYGVATGFLGLTAGLATGGLALSGLVVGGLGAHWLTEPGQGPRQAPAPAAPRRANLDTLAGDLARFVIAETGYNDIATTAVVQYPDGTYEIFAQRGYNVSHQVGDLLVRYGLPAEIDFTTPDGGDRKNIHAEMLAISEYLKGNRPLPARIGASRAVCAYCATVLQHLRVAIESPIGGLTTNWNSPYQNAGKPTPAGLLVPRSRTRGRDYKDDAYRA